MSSDYELAQQLAIANRILVDQGILDGFGHVSARSTEHPDHFLISRNLAPALVTADDVQLLDQACAPADDRPRYLEAFIHAEIYRARPDVQAVVHSHSPVVVPFSASPIPLRPLIHMAGFLYPEVPVWDIAHDAGPDTDMLVRDSELGASLAESLGDAAVVLMRGHGATAVGQTLPEAVFRAVYTEVAAHAHAQALALGEPRFLSGGEAINSAATNAGQIGRAWDYWRSLVALP